MKGFVNEVASKTARQVLQHVGATPKVIGWHPTLENTLMKLNRRQVVRLAAAGGAGLLVPCKFAAAQQGASSAAEFSKHFSDMGAEVLDPLPLITGSSFNGGLRFDDTRKSYPGGMSVSVQPSSRIEDAGKSNETGVLALFHIGVLNLSTGAGPRDAIKLLLGYVVDEVGLDPEKLVFVSTEVFKPYFSSNSLLQKGRFVKRDQAEAMAAGDGSGFFAPAGHPETKGFATVSLHYPIGSGTSAELQYPLPDYLEIGEICLVEPGDGAAGPVGGGFGLERLAIATGAPAPDYADSRASLVEAVKKEASETGTDLPAGLKVFAD